MANDNLRCVYRAIVGKGREMAGIKGKSGGDRPGAGRPPQSITFRIGDAIGFRYGVGSPIELGEVIELHRGIPRTVILQLGNGEKVLLMVETPSEA